MIYVDIDGQQEKLSDCGWLMRRACGCIIAAATADQGDEVLATKEQFHKHMRPRRDSRERDLRNGFTFQLITMAAYRQDIGTKWECEQHPRQTEAASRG